MENRTDTPVAAKPPTSEEIANAIFLKIGAAVGLEAKIDTSGLEAALASLQKSIEIIASIPGAAVAPSATVDAGGDAMRRAAEAISGVADDIYQFLDKADRLEAGPTYGFEDGSPAASTATPPQQPPAPAGSTTPQPTPGQPGPPGPSGSPGHPGPPGSPGGGPQPQPNPGGGPNPNPGPNPPPSPSQPPSPNPNPNPSPHPNFSPVTAFDRPQAVIVMGPKPLPVSIVGGGASTPKGEDPKLNLKFPEFKGMASMLSAFSGAMTAAATSTTAAIDVLHAYTGAIGQLNSMVEKYDPGAAYQFNDAVMNMEAAIGKLLVPVIKQATVVINAINGAIGGMSGSSKAAFAAFAGAGAIMAAIGVAAGIAAAVMIGFAAALTAVAAAASAIPVVGQIGAVLGAIIAPLVGLGVAGAGAAAGMMTFASLTAKTSTLLSVLNPILSAVMGGFDKMSPKLLDIMEKIAPLVVAVVTLAAELGGMMADILAADGVLEMLAISAALAAASLALLLAPIIMLAGAAILATIAIWGLLRAFGLIGDSPKFKPGAETKAVHSASFMSAQSLGEKAYANAYSMGNDKEEDPTVNLTTATNGLKQSIDLLKNGIDFAIDVIKNIKFPGQETVGKVADFAQNNFRHFLPSVGSSLGGPVGGLLGQIGKRIF